MEDEPENDIIDLTPAELPPPLAIAPSFPVAPGNFRSEVISAYVVTAARLVSWAAVSAVVYRRLGAGAFAMLALVRSTIGLLSYTSIGLAPALVRMLAEARTREAAVPLAVVAKTLPAKTSGLAPVLAYSWLQPGQSPPSATPLSRIGSVYRSGETLALSAAVIGMIAVEAYERLAPDMHDICWNTTLSSLIISLGAGVVVRLVSEAPASLLQVSGRIALDNFLLAAAELCFMVLSIFFVFGDADARVDVVGHASLLSMLLLLCARNIFGRSVLKGHHGKTDARTQGRLVRSGASIALAQSADFLYAPTDNLLISGLIGAATVAVYAPAVQIDSGLLMIVSGLAGVILPKSAVAHAAGDRAAVRRYYVFGTLVSAALLVLAGAVVWTMSGWVFQLWLGDPLPQTQKILPLILIHTVIGGSSGIGRSVLLGMGKVRAYTQAALIGGLTNVVLSFCFVKFLGLGLPGIILGTIVAVVGRCALWMPWYIVRELRSKAQS